MTSVQRVYTGFWFIYEHAREYTGALSIREFKLHVSGNGKRQGSNFLGKIFVERFRFIFSFLRRKNNYVFQF